MAALNDVKRFKKAYPEMSELDDATIFRYLKAQRAAKRELDRAIDRRVKSYSRKEAF